MTQLTIFVDHDLLVDEFVQKALDGRIGCLLFNDEDFLMKNHGLMIKDTELCNSDILYFDGNLKTLRLPEGYFVKHSGYRFSLNKYSVFKTFESLTLNSHCLFPFDLVEQSMLKNFKIEGDSSGKACSTLDITKSKEVFKKKQIPHENFTYDISIKRKLDVHLAAVSYDINDALLETGAMMSGVYVSDLMKIYIPVHYECHKEIYSYTLDFLRIFLKNALSKGKDMYVLLKEYDSVYKYEVFSYIKYGSRTLKSCFYFYHLGKEDIYIPADENRERVKQYLCETAELTSQLPCYDGENIYANSCVNDNRVYVRLTDVEFSESMIEKNNPKYIAASGLKFVSRTKECREDEYSMSSWDYEYYIIVPEDFDEDEPYIPDEVYFGNY